MNNQKTFKQTQISDLRGLISIVVDILVEERMKELEIENKEIMNDKSKTEPRQL